MVRDTPSSMHSFYELTNIMDAGLPFVVTTVDTIFKEEEFSAYLVAFLHMLKKREGDGLMGVTDYIDDEKPLYFGTGLNPCVNQHGIPARVAAFETVRTSSRCET